MLFRSPNLSISYPGTLNLNQAKTISWAGGRQSNTIIMERFDPINETFNSQTLVSNSILVSGSVSFTPTVAGAMHFFSIEATDANGDMTSAGSANAGVIPS